MSSTPTRLALGGVTAAAISLSLSAAPAHAESAEIGYMCSKTESGQGGFYYPLTARFDSAIKDRTSVPIGTSVQLSPVQGTFTLSSQLVQAIRGDVVEAGNATFRMDGYVVTDLDGDSSGERDIVRALTEFTPEPYTTTNNSPVTLKATGTAPAFTVKSLEGLTYAAGEISARFEKPRGDVVGYLCRINEGTEDRIDLVKGAPKGTATPTPTPTPTQSPSRPTVVQTDAAQSAEGHSWLPLAAAGAGSIMLLGGALAATRRRAVRR